MGSEDYQTSLVQDMADKFASQLGKHCVGVRIIMSIDIDSGHCSRIVSSGDGNYHAQYGAVEKWLKYEDNHDLALAINCNTDDGGGHV